MKKLRRATSLKRSTTFDPVTVRFLITEISRMTEHIGDLLEQLQAFQNLTRRLYDRLDTLSRPLQTIKRTKKKQQLAYLPTLQKLKDYMNDLTKFLEQFKSQRLILKLLKKFGEFRYAFSAYNGMLRIFKRELKITVNIDDQTEILQEEEDLSNDLEEVLSMLEPLPSNSQIQKDQLYIERLLMDTRHRSSVRSLIDTIHHSNQNSAELALPDLNGIRMSHLDFQQNDDRLLGEGGFGKVYKSYYNDKPTALKILDISYEEMSKDHQKEAHREALILQHLAHLGIVTLKGIAIERGYFLMERAEGSLADLIDKNSNHPMKENMTHTISLWMFHDVATTMNYLHSLNILHSDLKPKNMLVFPNYKIKLTDFGISTFRDEVQRNSRNPNERTGTPQYSAPEVIGQGQNTVYGDVYSYFISLNEALDGNQPFQDVSNVQLVAKVFVKDERPNIFDSIDLSEDISTSLKNMITKGWQKTPELRGTFQIIPHELKTLLGVIGIDPRITTKRHRKRLSQHKRPEIEIDDSHLKRDEAWNIHDSQSTNGRKSPGNSQGNNGHSSSGIDISLASVRHIGWNEEKKSKDEYDSDNDEDPEDIMEAFLLWLQQLFGSQSESEKRIDDLKSASHSAHIPLVLDTLNDPTFMNNDEVCEECFRAIEILSRDEIRRGRLGDAGVCEAVVTALEFHLDSLFPGFYRTTIECGLRAIINLSAHNKNNRTRLGKGNACAIVTRALVEHITSESICKQATKAIRNLSNNHLDNQHLLGSAGACEAVINALKEHLDSEEISAFGFWAIRSLATNNAENQTLFGACGACELISNVISNIGPGNENVAAYTCTVLAVLTHNHPSNQTKLGEAKACEAVVDLMKQYMNNETVCEKAALAIGQLSQNHESNNTRLGDCEACETISRALLTHISNIITCENCCWAVMNLSLDDANQSWLGEAGICEYIVQVLENHIDLVSLCDKAIWVIALLAYNHFPNQERLRDEGACEAIIETLDRHSENKEIMIHVCGAIRNLDAVNFGRFGAAGACESLVDILRTNLHDELICEDACRAIGSLAADETNRIKLGTAGACETVATVLRENLGNESVIACSCLALGDLALKNKKNQGKLKVTGISKILRDLAEKSNKPEIQMWAGDAFTRING